MAQGESAADARYAPPRAEVEDVRPDADGLELATRTRRFWAAMIDVAIATVVLVLAAFFSPWNPWADLENASQWRPEPLNTVITFAIFLALHGWLLAWRGQTLGKAMLGIRIIRSDGGAASAWRLLGIRYGVGYGLMVIPAIGQVFAFIDALFIFGERRRCVHDRMADTIVVRV